MNDTPTDPTTLLRDILERQARIAKGLGRGVTAAQETAAARQVLDLIQAIEAREQQASGQVQWDDMPETIRAAAHAILSRPEAFAEAVVALETEMFPPILDPIEQPEG